MCKKLLILFIRFYQLGISPLLPKSCRFYPSCSCYAEEALQKHGIFKGLKLATLRVIKCGPWHPGGYDPVPDEKENPRC
ncbi:membrane protein insertion efficiency factor YidD [Estrella lausannensis]|uniref:Putative membrane protein insertion efficiency factor n=1 Tax=Estrella lausannensis TaxID=483423 RepID=A0A0H5DNA5_9BACT|nr:membrane protein insertion efficiency factor YidD [Estrella lausannensis]CRX37771.1 conserved hypothetical protein [Estrella lausannensis]